MRSQFGSVGFNITMFGWRPLRLGLIVRRPPTLRLDTPPYLNIFQMYVVRAMISHHHTYEICKMQFAYEELMESDTPTLNNTLPHKICLTLGDEMIVCLKCYILIPSNYAGNIALLR